MLSSSISLTLHRSNLTCANCPLLQNCCRRGMTDSWPPLQTTQYWPWPIMTSEHDDGWPLLQTTRYWPWAIMMSGHDDGWPPLQTTQYGPWPIMVPRNDGQLAVCRQLNTGHGRPCCRPSGHDGRRPEYRQHNTGPIQPITECLSRYAWAWLMDVAVMPEHGWWMMLLCQNMADGCCCYAWTWLMDVAVMPEHCWWMLLLCLNIADGCCRLLISAATKHSNRCCCSFIKYFINIAGSYKNCTATKDDILY